MLGEADLRILTALTTPKTITGLSDTTGYSRGYVSERVSYLENYNLVTTTRDNHAKQVRALQTPVLETYRELAASHSHVDFPSLLSPSMLRVCWFLDTPTAVIDIQPRVTLRRRRIYQLLETLQQRGLIVKTKNMYAFPDDLVPLARFAQAVIKHEHRHRAQSLLPDAVVAWSAPHEALITTTGDVDVGQIMETLTDREHWQLAGLPRFEEYGLEFFIAGTPPMFYSELRDDLTPSDFICHTLLLEADTRHLSYCALLMLAADVDAEDLDAAATRYGIDDIVDALVEFVETHGETMPEMDHLRLPDWSEMTTLASQYGVSV